MDMIIRWLLAGDVSIQYLTNLLLLERDADVLKPLQGRIEKEGFGARLLSYRKKNGHWGIWFYQPKWTCTHYTLLTLKDIGTPNMQKDCREMVKRAFDECMLSNGGINFSKTMVQSDIAIDGMVLNYASYFLKGDKRIEKLAEYILSEGKPDGGYSWANDSKTSDPHTTICVLEGFYEYKKAGFTKLLTEIRHSEVRALDWLLSKGLFMTNDDKRYRKLSYPYRYRYDILRALEYFAINNVPYEKRMLPSIQWLEKKRDVSGFWYLENIHKGNVHFHMEEKGAPSRFITLKALFIQKIYRYKLQ